MAYASKLHYSFGENYNIQRQAIDVTALFRRCSIFPALLYAEIIITIINLLLLLLSYFIKVVSLYKIFEIVVC